MLGYRGDISAGATLCFSFNTRDSSGNPVTLTGSPVVSVYKNAGTTACTTPPVLTINNGQTGRHTVTVNTGVDTTFYAAGNDYSAVLTAGTVNGISVVSVEVASFSINNRTVAAVLTGMATHADATAIGAAVTALGSPLQATAYVAPTTPPTVVQIRQEMDTNSTKLSNLTNLDVAVSSRLATTAYAPAPTVSAIQSGLANHNDVTAIGVAITALGSPLQATAYVAPTVPPTVVQIRQEMDTNSTKLAAGATSIGVTAAANAVLAAVGSPLQSGSYVIPPSAAAIAATTAAVMLVDGTAHPLKVNSDHSVSTSSTSTSPVSIVVPAAVAIASQDPMVMTCLRGDTLRFTLPEMGDLSNRTKLVFTAKANVNDSDSMAVLQVLEGTGLVRLNGSGQVISSTASLTVTSDSTGTVNLEIDASVTAALAVQDLAWDVQVISSTGVTTPVRGMLTVVADVTQAVT